MQNLLNRPLVRQETALMVAEHLLKERWSPDASSVQLPLEVEDAGEAWRVLGAKRENYEPEGRFYIRIRKDNGKIDDIGMYHGTAGVPD